MLITKVRTLIGCFSSLWGIDILYIFNLVLLNITYSNKGHNSVTYRCFIIWQYFQGYQTTFLFLAKTHFTIKYQAQVSKIHTYMNCLLHPSYLSHWKKFQEDGTLLVLFTTISPWMPRIVPAINICWLNKLNYSITI